MLQTNSVTKQIEGKAVSSKLYQTHHLFIRYNWTDVTLEPIFHKMTHYQCYKDMASSFLA